MRRLLIFAIIGLLVGKLSEAAGTRGPMLLLMFVSGGLGAVAAYDLRAYWRRRRERQIEGARSSDHNGGGPL
jgi:hypothetical protein